MSLPHGARMGRVYDFIQDHLNEDLSVARLAEVAILSPWHFQRVFLAFSGEPVAAFVRRLRLERAADRLLTRDWTVEAVAADCGFGSAELLARHFQKRFGTSPSAWRGTDPLQRYRTIRQAAGATGQDLPANIPDPGRSPGYPGEQPLQGELTDLRLERRPARRVIYTRQFRGYDHEASAAFERLWHWAHPRGLLGPGTPALGIGLDNPWITEPQRCRLLCCYPVEGDLEVGEDIGLRTLVAGLYAVFGYRGPRSELPLVYEEIYRVHLPRAGVEAVDDLNYLEWDNPHPSSLCGEEMHCRLALHVRSV